MGLADREFKSRWHEDYLSGSIMAIFAFLSTSCRWSIWRVRYVSKDRRAVAGLDLGAYQQSNGCNGRKDYRHI